MLALSSAISRKRVCDWLRGLATEAQCEPWPFAKDWHPHQVLRFVMAAIADGRVPGDHPVDKEDLSLASAERWTIVRAMTVSRGRKREAARRLGIGKTTLYRKLRTHKIESWEWEREEAAA